MFRQSIYTLVIISLILSSITPATASARAIQPTIQPSNDPTNELSIYLAPPDSQPLLRAIPTDLPTLYQNAVEFQQSVGPYRTTVRIRSTADLARLKKIGVTILASNLPTSPLQGRTRGGSATVIADRLQLEQLAKLQFQPRQTELTARLKTATRAPLSTTATASQVLAATATDSDNDGLNDTEEGWWCTDPNNPDSNNDGIKDGDHVQALRDWLAHNTTTRPAAGRPFSGWPPNHAGCIDADMDSVPDAVEIYVFGLNPNRESTARDKFDDGQKLFGTTYCPGTGNGCSYGSLPRTTDWGVIFAEMPSWVKPPYDSPFVAAFPQPDIEVVDNSIVVTAKTLIQSSTTVQSGQANTYGTAETRGTSSSVADTVTWNNWQEVATTKPSTSAPIRLNPQFTRSPSAVQKTPAEIKSEATWDFIGDSLGVIAACVGTGPVGCAIAGAAGVAAAKSQSISLNADLQAYKDQVDRQAPTMMCTPSSTQATQKPTSFSVPACPAAGVRTQPTQQEVIDDQTETTSTQDLNKSGAGILYSTNNQGQLVVQPSYSTSYPIASIPSTTSTSGQSWGGARTATHTEYEEHTISQSQEFMNSTAWATATTTDTVHAADLTFTYRVSNKGTDYARELSNLAFNIYLGDDPNPVCTYFVGSSVCGNPTGATLFSNIMPGDTHTFTSSPVPLTLNQMKAIDTGSPIYITVEDYSYGVDELFYQDAVDSGIMFLVDGGDGILHRYVVPTWKPETVQDVVQRFFPSTVDANNNLLSLSVPDYSTTTPTWVVHALTDTAWWNLYLNNLGDGSAAFKDTPAVANSTVLIRMNSDTDRDGYSDRTELALGTNPNDPASHPSPQLVAATHSTRVGNTVTVNMAFLNSLSNNSGNYDAYGVEAVMYAPDATTTINDNTIGGSGRVKSASQVVLGSRILAPSTTNWRGTSKPYSTGSYSGNTDKVFTFTAANPGNIGSAVPVNVNWTDGTNSGTVDFGSNYQAPSSKTIRDGLQIGFDTGTVNAGDVFTVAAQLPRDTFSYTINQDPYTVPVVVVSYNDPQGNHKFVTPVEVSDLGWNLAPYASQMLPGVGVDISTNAAFNASGNNTVYLVASSPHPQSIVNGHLFVEFVNDAGTVVAEQVFTQTFQIGPTVAPVTFNPASFNPAYQAGHDYTLLAFFTDAQGNIIDSHARLFSTFANDPVPQFNMGFATDLASLKASAPRKVTDVGWNFGSVTQGQTAQKTFAIANTGLLPLKVAVSNSDSTVTVSNISGIVSIAPSASLNFVVALDTTGLSGAINKSLTIRSNDPINPVTYINISGTVNPPGGQAVALDIANRPLDKTVRVYGNVPQFNAVDFTHGIQPDTATIEPCKVYAADGTTLKGVGKYCADFNVGTVSAQVFGTGADGALTVTGSQTINNTRTALSATSTAGQPTLNVASTSGFAVGQEVLIHQTQGTGAGNYEFGKIASIGSGTLTLQGNLSNTYTQGGNSRAQVIQVPQYTSVTVQNGGTLTAPAWDGTTGGILTFRATGTLTVSNGGTLNASGKGFRGGTTENAVNSYGHGGEGVAGFSGTGGGYGDFPSGGGGNDDGNNGGGPGQYYTGGGGSGRARIFGYDESAGGGGGGGHVFGGGGGASGVDSNGPGQAGGAATGVGGGHGGDDLNSYGNGIGAGGTSGGVGVGSNQFSGPGGAGHANRSPGGGGGGANYPDSTDGTTMVFGGGGGAGSRYEAEGTGHYNNGGNGGGIIYLVAQTLSIAGSVTANGQSGSTTGSARDSGGGGGAGGYVFLIAQNMSLGTNLVTVLGGSGAGPTAYGGGGGAGSIGRAHIEYQNISPTYSTNPPATTQTRIFFIAEKSDSSTVHFYVPDTVTAPGQNYVMQFARRLAFAGAGNQLTYTRVVSQTYSSATMDALITNVGAGGATNLQIQVGNTPVFSQTQTITQPTTINIPNFASAVNQYIVSQPSASTIDVPMQVTIDRQADVMLTNLGLTRGAGVDLAVSTSDLAIGCPGAPSCLASEGNTIPVTVTVHNTGAQNVSSAVVGFYAGNPQSSGRLLGSSFLATIPAGGNATTSFNWNTEGYTHTQSLYAYADPSHAITETLENNNIVSQTLYIKTKPDLRVASIALSSTDRVVGEPLTTTVTISNTGETNAPAHFTNVTMRGEHNDSSSQDLPTGAVPATNTVNLSTPLAPILFGSHTLTVTADSTNVITESVETNNVLTRTFLVGLPAENIDAGAASDLAYTASSGFGYLNGSAYDFGGTITKTVRFDGSGTVQYRFDGLQPTRFYHLDATFYQEGDTFTQTVSFHGLDSGKIIPLNSGIASNVSILVPSNAYTDTTTTMIVAFQRGGSTSAASRLKTLVGTAYGPAVVSQLALLPIEYTYLDAGGASDVAYTPARGYGYLNGFAGGSGDAVGTYRSVFTNTVLYQFDNLNPAKKYTIDLTFYDASGSSRQQSVTADGVTICGPFTLSAVLKPQCDIPTNAYADGRVVIGIVRTNGSGPIVNEIALEENTSKENNLNPVPTLTALSPTSAVVGAAFTLTLTGTNFVNGSVAQWNGTDHSATFVSDTQLTTLIGATDLSAAGNASVTVFNPAPGGGTSNPLTFTVNQASTATTVHSSPNPSILGQTVTISATMSVITPGSGIPSGSVTFKDGTTVLGTWTLSSGVVQFTTSSLGLGPHSLTAIYGGDTNFSGSTSSPLTQTVNPVATVNKYFLPFISNGSGVQSKPAIVATPMLKSLPTPTPPLTQTLTPSRTPTLPPTPTLTRTLTLTPTLSSRTPTK